MLDFNRFVMYDLSMIGNNSFKKISCEKTPKMNYF